MFEHLLWRSRACCDARSVFTVMAACVASLLMDGTAEAKPKKRPIYRYADT
jgi:hypothetical protein